MGPIGSNGENYVRVTHRFPAKNYGELGTTEYGQGMGDTSSGGSTGETGMKSTAIYIGRRQGMLAQLVALHPLFKVCTRENGHEWGGGTHEGSMVTTGSYRQYSQVNLG